MMMTHSPDEFQENLPEPDEGDVEALTVCHSQSSYHLSWLVSRAVHQQSQRPCFEQFVALLEKWPCGGMRLISNRSLKT